MTRRVVLVIACAVELVLVATWITSLLPPVPGAATPPPQHHDYAPLIVALAIGGAVVLAIAAGLFLVGRRLFRQHMILTDTAGIFTGAKGTADGSGEPA